MGLKNCPNCNLMLFDTDTFCIYCGWGKEKTSNCDKTNERSKINDVPIEETKEPLTASDSPSQENTEETQPQIKPSNNQAAGANKVPIAEFKKGVRCINDVTFNIFDIIKNYGITYPIQIIKEIRRVSGASLSTAKTLFDEAKEDYILKYPEESSSPVMPAAKQTFKPTQSKTQKDSKKQAYTLMAYDLVLRHGPKRKVSIINELMRRVHIDLATAMDAVDSAIEKYNNIY